ncbi:hypothetical protein Bbelb_441730 [Branchiostoma belcheri]|nr:hypothetical protein Bbelb_441730 [Branchiostoma belcheri]
MACGVGIYDNTGPRAPRAGLQDVLTTSAPVRPSISTTTTVSCTDIFLPDYISQQQQTIPIAANLRYQSTQPGKSIPFCTINMEVESFPNARIWTIRTFLKAPRSGQDGRLVGNETTTNRERHVWSPAAGLSVESARMERRKRG